MVKVFTNWFKKIVPCKCTGLKGGFGIVEVLIAAAVDSRTDYGKADGKSKEDN